jgi:hypothetical protein
MASGGPAYRQSPAKHTIWMFRGQVQGDRTSTPDPPDASVDLERVDN